MKRLALLFLCISVSTTSSGITDYDNTPTIGPARGWLVIHGGGLVTPEVKQRCITLAGGPNAAFVVIPTAKEDSEIDPTEIKNTFSRNWRLTNVTVLHTRDRARANSQGFVEPLRRASGVWIDGGRQWRLADAYLGTAVETEIKALLNRGGVVCGSSAGATIQGSYLVRGAPAGSGIVMSPGHEQGFGLLLEIPQSTNILTRGVGRRT